MTKLCSTLISIVVFAALAAPAAGDPGTTWDKIITKNRFVVLKDFNNEAVFDRETGRVWERSPDLTDRSWFQALNHCYNLDIAARRGWRLPTIEELASLVDTMQLNPALPTGHPFENIQSVNYWSATTNAQFPNLARVVSFANGAVVVSINKDDAGALVWCVRGGQGIDGVQ